jgi:glycosyltransferase involved in cell wall biosynthesis
MRVLHLLDSLNRGGAETLALDVCRNAARFGIEMTLATCNGGPMEKDFGSSGVKLVRLPRRFPVDPSVVRGLRRVIEERGVQVVHGHQAVDGVHMYLAAQKLPEVKTVLSYHGFIPDAKNRLALKYLIPRMDANIVVSEGLRTWLREKDGIDTATLQVLYNGVDPERIRPSGRSIRAELGTPDGTLLAGMVGNFYRDPRKDQMTVVRSLPRVFAGHPDLHFLFAGRVEPGAEAKLEECKSECVRAGIADRVHFLGPRTDIPDILSALDLFVISSLQEGLPIALNEAMLAGVGVLASDIDPHVEASGNGRYAELFRTGDEVDLAEKMIGLLADAAHRKTLAEQAKKFAMDTFSIDAHLKRLIELYGSLFKEGRR